MLPLPKLWLCVLFLLYVSAVVEMAAERTASALLGVTKAVKPTEHILRKVTYKWE